MRFASLSVLLLSTVTLTACGGAGSEIASLDTGSGICGTNCPTVPIVPTGTAPTTPVNSGGQTLPPIDNVNGGNATQLTTGDTAITLENHVLTSTTSKKALVQVTIDSKNLATKTDDEAVFKISTTDGRNSGWPVPKKMLWQQTAQLLTPTQLGALKYDEYLSTERVNNSDISEQLQIWTYNNAYIGQYREVARAESPHQAWFFGGATKTALANMPTAAGTVTKTGQWTGSAKSYNIKEPGQTGLTVLTKNNWWGVRGTSTVNIDFANKSVDATLEPTHFTALANYDLTNPNVAEGDSITVDLAIARTNPLSFDRHNYFREFMDDQIQLTGTIAAGSGTGATAAGNQITNGTVKFINPYNDSPTDPTIVDVSYWKPVEGVSNFQGGFYGSSAQDFAGSFAVSGTAISGSGGITAITNNGQANYDVSGVLHAQ
jgi:hypothetical protein